jgi:Na+-transporting NADH:ubiquinone oxidoreductase subunit NqrB
MLRRLLDRIHPLFDQGGKLERLYPLYEALDTFLYTPGEVTHADAHVRDALDLKRMMSMVIVALLPCIFMAFWNTGYQANLAMQSRTGGRGRRPAGAAMVMERVCNWGTRPSFSSAAWFTAGCISCRSTSSRWPWAEPGN